MTARSRDDVLTAMPSPMPSTSSTAGPAAASGSGTWSNSTGVEPQHRREAAQAARRRAHTRLAAYRHGLADPESPVHASPEAMEVDDGCLQRPVGAGASDGADALVQSDAMLALALANEDAAGLLSLGVTDDRALALSLAHSPESHAAGAAATGASAAAIANDEYLARMLQDEMIAQERPMLPPALMGAASGFRQPEVRASDV